MVIVAAGMDGALPSVVSGLVNVPVIGLPTSVGYGLGGGGVAALLSMLQTCAPGLVVVNIDNGVGAGATAALIANRVAAARTHVLTRRPAAEEVDRFELHHHLVVLVHHFAARPDDAPIRADCATAWLRAP